MKTRSRRPDEPIIDDDTARSALKCIAVIMRDNTWLTFDQVVMTLAYCWRNTPTRGDVR